MATWLPAVLTAVLNWLTGLVVAQARKTGEDAVMNPEMQGKLDDRLSRWKKENRVPT